MATLPAPGLYFLSLANLVGHCYTKTESKDPNKYLTVYFSELILMSALLCYYFMSFSNLTGVIARHTRHRFSYLKLLILPFELVTMTSYPLYSYIFLVKICVLSQKI